MAALLSVMQSLETGLKNKKPHTSILCFYPLGHDANHENGTKTDTHRDNLNFVFKSAIFLSVVFVA